MNLQDLIGKRFGSLTVLSTAPEKSKYHLKCLCDCGNIRVVRCYDLINKKILSCGCYQKKKVSEMRLIDMVGKKYSRLTVLEKADDYISPQGIHFARWKCLCECGNTTYVTTNALRRGTIASCGCLYRETRPTFKDLTGKKFGTLTAISLAGYTEQGLALWKCKCDCGKELIVRGCHLRDGHTKHCGAGIHRKTHGGSLEPLYSIRTGMLQRCYNPNCSGYPEYGGRGITVCDEWREDYAKFREWAYSVGYSEEKLSNGLNRWSIDRIDVNGNYEPNNCRWVENSIQQRNKRNNVIVTYKGETMVASDIADKYNMPRDLIWKRLKYGWSIEKAIETPVRKRTVIEKETAGSN